jgi:hypothetical protein
MFVPQPRPVVEVLDSHVTLEVESIDRMYLNVYVPYLQREGGVATFFRKPGSRTARLGCISDSLPQRLVVEPQCRLHGMHAERLPQADGLLP